MKIDGASCATCKHNETFAPICKKCVRQSKPGLKHYDPDSGHRLEMVEVWTPKCKTAPEKRLKVMEVKK